MKRPEQKLQTAIVTKLRRSFDCFVTHVPNGGARTPLEALAFKDAGLTAGTPDLLACAPGPVLVFVEIKARILAKERGVPPFGRLASLDPAQQQVVQRLRRMGFRVAVVDSVEDAVEALTTSGFPPKAAAPARVSAPPRSGRKSWRRRP
jgi:hypothetical protein